jgi:hypothetical protein
MAQEETMKLRANNSGIKEHGEDLSVMTHQQNVILLQAQPLYCTP